MFMYIYESQMKCRHRKKTLKLSHTQRAKIRKSAILSSQSTFFETFFEWSGPEGACEVKKFFLKNVNFSLLWPPLLYPHYVNWRFFLQKFIFSFTSLTAAQSLCRKKIDLRRWPIDRCLYIVMAHEPKGCRSRERENILCYSRGRRTWEGQVRRS